MLKISAMVHICNNDCHLRRALESLRFCDEVMVVAHGCSEDALKVARECGARIVTGVNGVDHGAYAQDANYDWIFCLLPSESIAADLKASLQEWKQAGPSNGSLGYNIGIREQTGAEWKLLHQELRLVNRTQVNWTGDCPPEAPNAPVLPGYILRTSDE